VYVFVSVLFRYIFLLCLLYYLCRRCYLDCLIAILFVVLSGYYEDGLVRFRFISLVCALIYNKNGHNNFYTLGCW